MALTWDQVGATTQEILNESAADNIFASNPYAFHMLEKGKIVEEGGDFIKLPIEYAVISAAGNYNNYSLLDTNPNDTLTAARGDWRNYYVNVVISETELLRNSGKYAAVNLIKAKAQGAMKKLKDNLGTDLFSTNADSADGVHGLRALVEATGTSCNIAQSDFSGWASQEDNATSALSLSKMNALFLNCMQGDEGPDIIVTTKGVFGKYWSLLQAEQRFSEAKVGKGGFRYLMFNDVPIFNDSHVSGSGSGTADNHMFMLNSKWLYLYVNSKNNMKLTDIGPIASQAVYVQRLSLSCQQLTDNRRVHGKFTVLKH